jgi:hypothetical protein
MVSPSQSQSCNCTEEITMNEAPSSGAHVSSVTAIACRIADTVDRLERLADQAERLANRFGGFEVGPQSIKANATTSAPPASLTGGLETLAAAAFMATVRIDSALVAIEADIG